MVSQAASDEGPPTGTHVHGTGIVLTDGAKYI